MTKSQTPPTNRRAIISPSSEKTIAHVQDAGQEEVHLAVSSAQKAFPLWALKSPAERASLLLNWASLIEKNLSRLALLESQNTGKPLKLSQDGDLPFAIDNLRFFASAARVTDAPAASEYSTGYLSFLKREPLGPVALITPWNYPLMMAIWKMAPALAAGNSCVIKPSELTPLTTLEIAKLALKAGFPEGVINVVLGGEETGKLLTSHSEIKMISFTGDTATGRKIMSQASNTVKRLHLELGGKAPFIVFDDADLSAAVLGAVVGSFVNAGQDCTAATRLYIHKKVFDRFTAHFVTETKKIKLGLFDDPATDMGPLISEDQRARVEGFLSRAEGIEILHGGHRPKNLKKGFFFEPTVIAKAEQNSELVQKEIFGPVVCLLPFKDEDEAVKLANDVPYGLAASVWTKDAHKALRVSSALRFGTVWINDHLPLASETPHGGFNQSGFGKDLSRHALEEYTTLKHVMADLSGEARKPWHYTVFGKK